MGINLELHLDGVLKCISYMHTLEICLGIIKLLLLIFSAALLILCSVYFPYILHANHMILIISSLTEIFLFYTFDLFTLSLFLPVRVSVCLSMSLSLTLSDSLRLAPSFNFFYIRLVFCVCVGVRCSFSPLSKSLLTTLCLFL